MIATVTGSEIRKNRDAPKNRIVLQVTTNDTEDVQTVEMMSSPGEEMHPRPGCKVYVVDVGKTYRLAIVGDDGIEPSAAVGEKKIYSLDAADAIAAIIHWMEDGQLVLNMGSGTAVEFKRLKTAFDQLKDDFDKHVHSATGVMDSEGGACTGTTSAIAVGSSADIDPAESPTVQVP